MMQVTPRCQQALDYAKESLPRFRHSYVSSTHLVLGLLTLRGGIGDGVLRKIGFSFESVETYLSSRRDPPEQAAVLAGAELGSSAASALARAEGEAHIRQHGYLGVEHLLLGILGEERGEAADLFASVNADRDSMRRDITEMMQ